MLSEVKEVMDKAIRDVVDELIGNIIQVSENFRME